jgi:hypothetical protein
VVTRLQAGPSGAIEFRTDPVKEPATSRTRGAAAAR